MTVYNTPDIMRLFELLNSELAADGIAGELFVVGGAVMCLGYEARPSTQDVDAFFRPVRQVREAAARVAVAANAHERWLNDAVKGFLSAQGAFKPFLELSHLRISIARADYLLAMKCLSMRIGAEFHDVGDIRYRLRHLDIQDYQQVLDIIGAYYPLEQFPQKTFSALKELLVEPH